MADTEWTVEHHGFQRKYSRIGTIRSNNFAVFKISYGLAWSINGFDAGFKSSPLVPSVNIETLVKEFSSLVNQDWTICILEDVSVVVKIRPIMAFVDNLIDQVRRTEPRFNPFVVLNSCDIDEKYMWTDLKKKYNFNPSAASFFCGSSIGKHFIIGNIAGRYVTSRYNEDKILTKEMELDFYESTELFGEYIPRVNIDSRVPQIIMAINGVQYNDFLRAEYEFQMANFDDDIQDLEFITNVKTATAEDRLAVLDQFPNAPKIQFLLFTRPIEDYWDLQEIANKRLYENYYANALDIDLKMEDKLIEGPDGRIEIIRIN